MSIARWFNCAPAVLAGAFVACVAVSPCSGASESEVDAALQSVQAGEFAPAIEVAGRILRDEPGDWRGWYLRSLAQHERPMDASERAPLNDLPTPLAAELRGLLDYVGSPSDDREVVARALVEALPASALAHTLLGSSLLPQGRADDALKEAERALDLDPALFLAARVELIALQMLDEIEPLRAGSCALLPRFPHDTLVIHQALATCTPDPDLDVRWAQWSPLLTARRGRTEALLALQRLVADPTPAVWPSRLQKAAATTLDPADSSWWPMGATLVGRFGGAVLNSSDRLIVLDFATKLHRALLASPDAIRDRLLEVTTRLLADLHDRGGRGVEARSVVETTLGHLPPLQQSRLLNRLAKLECTAGFAKDAASHAAEAFALSHPFETVPRVLPGACGLPAPQADSSAILQRLTAFTLSDAGGRPRTLEFPAARSTLLVFWSVDCLSSTSEAKRIARLLTEPSGPFAKHALDLIWINIDSAESKARTLERAREFGIPPEQVVFAGLDAPLPGVLRVTGTPTLFLIAPNGLVVWETRGYQDVSWAPEVDRILRARELTELK